MATIERRKGKKGVSYRIVVSDGYDERGRQRRHFKTWKPSDGMTETQIQKELKKIAYEFENQLEIGFQPDSKVTFAEFAEYVYKLREMRGDKPQTLERVKRMTEKINEHIGNMKLVDIRPQHLNKLYTDLGKPGSSTWKRFAVPAVDFKKLLTDRGYNGLADKCQVRPQTIKRCCNGERVTVQTAEKIEKALCRSGLFDVIGEDGIMSPGTIRDYHGIIYTVLQQAEKEMILQYNAAARATLPKNRRTRETAVLQPRELKHILDALENEPLWFKVLIHLYMVTGCRRGEILATTWAKINFARKELTIDESVNYTKGKGVFIGTTKTENTRYIILPDETIDLLHKYRLYQLERAITSEDGLLFPNGKGEPLHPGTVNMRLTTFCEKNGLRHIHPHEFRHSVASILIANGEDIATVSALLGHKDPTTTLETYTHAIEEKQRRNAKNISDVILHQKENFAI